MPSPVRLHPYAVIFTLMTLVIVGMWLVKTRTVPPKQGATITWSGGGSISPTGEATPSVRPEEKTPIQELREGKTVTFPVLGVRSNEETAAPLQFDSSFSALLSTVLRPTQNTGAKSAYPLADSYQFFPTTEPPGSDAARTTTPLYVYGNQMGSLIQTFETGTDSRLSTLKNFFSNRKNAGNRTGIESIAATLDRLGQDIGLIQPPPEALQLHKELVAAYGELSKKMRELPRAESDADLIAALNAYNASADRFGKIFAAIVILFQASDVQFASSDPGIVFSFSAASR